MKSKIKFGLGSQNKEVIIGNVYKIWGDDVRDRIAAGFVENMGYDSNLCFLRFYASDTPGESYFEIYPMRADLEDCSFIAKSIPLTQLINLTEVFKEEIKARPAQIPEVKG